MSNDSAEIVRPGARLAAPLLAFALAAACDSDEGDVPEHDVAEQGVYQPESGRKAAPDWPEVGDAELMDELESAIERARDGDKKVLLEFVAPWCPDCREVVRVAQKEPAAGVLDSQYERVFVNVGRFDRHEELRDRYDVEAIATLVVLDGEGELVARTTLEPITEDQPLSPQSLAAWLRDPTSQGTAGGAP